MGLWTGQPVVGDTVRIITEGVVTWVGEPYVEVDGHSLSLDSPTTKSFYIIKKKSVPVVAGNTVKGEDLDDAPVGTLVVLSGEGDDAYRFKINHPDGRTRWTGLNSAKLASTCEYKVIFVPAP